MRIDLHMAKQCIQFRLQLLLGFHQALQQDDDWCERVLARDFAQAYDVQVRMISTLHNDPQG